jgi:hypothetical protein
MANENARVPPEYGATVIVNETVWVVPGVTGMPARLVILVQQAHNFILLVSFEYSNWLSSVIVNFTTFAGNWFFVVAAGAVHGDVPYTHTVNITWYQLTNSTVEVVLTVAVIVRLEPVLVHAGEKFHSNTLGGEVSASKPGWRELGRGWTPVLGYWGATMACQQFGDEVDNVHGDGIAGTPPPKSAPFGTPVRAATVGYESQPSIVSARTGCDKNRMKIIADISIFFS